MRPHRWIWSFAVVAALTFAIGAHLREEAPIARAADAPAPFESPSVLALSGVPGETSTDLVALSASAGPTVL
ncbi:MAG: hypothetical protein ACOC1F_09995, partial [Myxococcota bacterium]